MISQTAIRATEITDHSITLTNVADEFAAAVYQSQAAEHDYDYRPDFDRRLGEHWGRPEPRGRDPYPPDYREGQPRRPPDEEDERYRQGRQ
jgi:hypothetical protein